jgi:hypothetical protein
VLTFKEWKTLNENFGGAIPIGLGQPSAVVGVVGAQFGDEAQLEEAKKGKKKMFGDEEPEKDDDEDKEVKIVVKGKKDDDKDDDEDKGEEKGEDKGEEKVDKEPDGDKDDKPAFLMSKKKCKGCNCKSDKKMAKENKEWYGSVINQLNSDPNAKFWDGFSTIEEDALLAPADQNAGLVDGEPAPGSVGSAPVQRVGGWFGG